MPADYRRRVKAQFDVLEQDARTQRNKFDGVVVGIRPVLTASNRKLLLNLTAGRRAWISSSKDAR